MSRLHVAVLMGGSSTEREVSLSSGRQVLAALDPAKYYITALDAAGITAQLVGAPKPIPLPPGSPAEPALVLLAISSLTDTESGGRPDLVFIALHGKGGEDGTIQGLLDLMGVRYTGSGVLASALAMDKSMAKRILAAEGVPVAKEVRIAIGAYGSPDPVNELIVKTMCYPVIVKPNSQGSTIGCTIVHDSKSLDSAIRKALKFDSVVLVEEFLTGTEVTVGLLGNEDPMALPIIEILAKGGFYDYEAKYAPGGSEHRVPAQISEIASDKVRDYAIRSHRALGCRGMSRVDFIVKGDDAWVLEVNTIPGLTPTSLLPDAARAAGISFPQLLDRIIESALE